MTYGGWGAPTRSGSFFDFHVGTAIIDTVKILWGTGTGAFRPEEIEYLPDGSMRLSYRDPGAEHISHYRPKEKWLPRVIEADYRAVVVISRTERGFHLSIEVGGWAEMPINIQLLLRENCQLRTGAGQVIALEKGGHTFTDGSPYELIGPDGSRLRMSGMPRSEHGILIGDGRTITGDAERRCHRLAAAIFTPCSMKLSLEEA